MPPNTVAHLRHLVAPAVLALLLPAATAASAWELIGRDPLAPETQVYLKREALEEVEAGSFYVMTLTVHPTTVRGIDLPTSSGGLEYDTRYPHRSYVQISIYDCAQRMNALGQTLYFSGTSPKEEELVYKHVEEEGMLFPEFPGDPVYGAVCQ